MAIIQVITVLLLISMLPKILGQEHKPRATSTKHLGRMIAPTRWATIHLKLAHKDYQEHAKQLRRQFGRIERLAEDADAAREHAGRQSYGVGRGYKTAAQDRNHEDLRRFMQKADSVVADIVREYDDTVQLIFEREEERHKRGITDFGIGTIISLGLGIANRVDIEAMKSRVQGLADTDDAIIATMSQLAKETDSQLHKLRQKLKDFQQDQLEAKEQEVERRLKTETRRLLRQWQEDADEFEIGVTDLLAGHISPHIVGPKALKGAIGKLVPELDARNLRLVTWPNPTQAAYIAEATIIADKSGGRAAHIRAHPRDAESGGGPHALDGGAAANVASQPFPCVDGPGGQRVLVSR